MNSKWTSMTHTSEINSLSYPPQRKRERERTPHPGAIPGCIYVKPPQKCWTAERSWLFSKRHKHSHPYSLGIWSCFSNQHVIWILSQSAFQQQHCLAGSSKPDFVSTSLYSNVISYQSLVSWWLRLHVGYWFINPLEWLFWVNTET